MHLKTDNIPHRSSIEGELRSAYFYTDKNASCYFDAVR
jgi:hypothetical protein